MGFMKSGDAPGIWDVKGGGAMKAAAAAPAGLGPWGSIGRGGAFVGVVVADDVVPDAVVVVVVGGGGGSGDSVLQKYKSNVVSV